MACYLGQSFFWKWFHDIISDFWHSANPNRYVKFFLTRLSEKYIFSFLFLVAKFAKKTLILRGINLKWYKFEVFTSKTYLVSLRNFRINHKHLFLDRKIRWVVHRKIQAKTQWGGLDFPHLLYCSPVVFSQLYLDLWACESR